MHCRATDTSRLPVAALGLLVLALGACHERSRAPARGSGRGSATAAPAEGSAPGTTATGTGTARPRAAARAPSRASPYSVAPLLASLRGSRGKAIARQLGLADLGQLPYYEIDIALDLAGARLAGSYVLHYRNRTGKPLRRLPLLLHPNAPRELGAKLGGRLKITAVKALHAPPVTFVARRPTLAELRFARPVPPGAWLQLRVSFLGRLRRLPAGSNDVFSQALASLGVASGGGGASDYGLLAVGDGIATVASAYPMVAPYREGSFDVGVPGAFGDLAYNEPANFRLRTVVARGTNLVTNLVERGAPRALAGDKLVFDSVGAAVRDLVIVAGRGMKRRSARIGDIRVTSVFLPRDARAGARVLHTARGALELYQRRFGRYPYRELDVAQATLVGGAGGVEFPAMVLVAGMFYRKPSVSGSPLATLSRLMGGLGGVLRGGKRRPGGASAGLLQVDRMLEQMRAFVVAHEVAHQYFAGLVGSDCRRYPAIDEPLAQFAAGEYVRQVHGPRAGQRIFDLNTKVNYGVYRMIGGEDLPAAQPVRAFPSALAYAAIVYGKAPYYYQALRRTLGPRRFDRALRAAVDSHRFQLVTLEQWIASIERAAGGAPAVRRLARRYLYGRNGDRDLGVDPSGDAVLGMLLGPQALAQIKQGLGALGLKPAALFRMLLGPMARGQRGGPAVDPLKALRQLERLK